MAEWIGLAAEWLAPIYQEIKKGIFARGYVQVDETPIRLKRQLAIGSVVLRKIKSYFLMLRI